MKKLEDIPKRNNFKVPDGYFENFDKNILLKEDQDSYKNTFNVFKPYIYVAACILLLVGGLKVFLETVVEDENKNKQPVITESLEYYSVDELIVDIAEDDLVFYEYLMEQDINYQEELQQIDVEYIEDYLAQYYIEYELFEK